MRAWSRFASPSPGAGAAQRKVTTTSWAEVTMVQAPERRSACSAVDAAGDGLTEGGEAEDLERQPQLERAGGAGIDTEAASLYKKARRLIGRRNAAIEPPRARNQKYDIIGS
jgi:hypothetical protein